MENIWQNGKEYLCTIGNQKKVGRNPVGKLSTIFPWVAIFVYYKNMKFTDKFTIVLNSRQHELMLELFSGAAGLDLPPTCEPEFNSLWESVIECHHEIVEEDS